MDLILNADDFGASDDTVDATIQCFEQGALTSASIMPHMPGADRAVTFARANPQFSFGLHFTCVADGQARALASPRELGSLVGPDGRFRSTNRIRAMALLRRLPGGAVQKELAAQLGRLRDAGVRISHVDSHRHMHKLPAVRDALEAVLPRFGIHRVRTVQDVYLRRPLASPTYWLGHVWRARIVAAFSTTRHFYMPASAGDVDWAEPLAQRLTSLNGSLEVGVHPGFQEPWRSQEREAVLEFARVARGAGHQLITWADLPAAPK